MTSEEKEKRVTALLDFGVAMLLSGGEIERTESSVVYLSRAFGAVDTRVFAIPSLLLVTVDFGDGQLLTHSARIRRAHATNFHQLTYLNELCRKACREEMSVEAFREEFSAYPRTPSHLKRYLGGGLAAGAFAIFFGGTLWDGLFSLIAGILVLLFQDLVSPYSPNRVFLLFVSSFFAGALISPVAHFLPLIHRDLVSIGVVMLLVPGIAVSLALRDLIVGDTISGSLQLVEGILLTLAMAGGFMASIALWGVIL